MKALVLTLRQLGELVRSQRKLWVPFLLAAAVEALLIGLIWLAPQPPFSRVLAPPIRYFFSDRVLHYPVHLWFLYHAMKHTHLMASTLAGAFLTGIACVMVRQVHEGKPLSLRDALAGRHVRYGRVMLLWVLSWGMAKGITAAFFHVTPHAAWVFWGGIVVSLLLQALLIYAIPAAVFEGSAWWKALWQSLREAIRYPFSTLIIVAVCGSLVILFALSAPPTRLAHWMVQTRPEIALLLVSARLIVWMLSDVLMTIAIAHLWWVHRAAPVAAASPSAGPGLTRPAASAASSVLTSSARARLSKPLLLALGLLICGCSASYDGERFYWKALRDTAPLMNDLSRATPEQFAQAIARLEQVVQQSPGSVWAGRAQSTIGSLYSAQKRYRQAREAYALVLQNYPSYPLLCFSARLGTAKTYEIEQNLGEAVKAYRAVIDYHPWTRMGLETPFYIAKMYEARQQSGRARNAYERAIQHYTKLIPLAPNPEMAIQVKWHLALAHQRLREWEEAIEILEELAKAPEGVNRPLALLTLGALYHGKMHNLQRAQEIYTALSREFPEHPFGKAAKAQLSRLVVPKLPEVDPKASSVGGAPSTAAPTPRSSTAVVR